MNWLRRIFSRSSTVVFAVGYIEEFDSMKNFNMYVLSSQLRPCADNVKISYVEICASIKNCCYQDFVMYCLKHKIQFRKIN